MKQKNVILVNPLDKNYQRSITLLIDPSLDKGSSFKFERKLFLPKKIIGELQLAKVSQIDGVDSKIKFGDSFYGFAQLLWEDIEKRVLIFEGDETSQIKVSRDFVASMMGIEVERNWKKGLLLASALFALTFPPGIVFTFLWLPKLSIDGTISSIIAVAIFFGLTIVGMAFFGTLIFLPGELAKLKKVDAYLNGLKDSEKLDS